MRRTGASIEDGRRKRSKGSDTGASGGQAAQGGVVPGIVDHESDASPLRGSPSEKENRWRSPGGKSGGKSGSRVLAADREKHKAVGRGSLQQILDSQAS